jgi:phosphatidylserine/phosphatidylglycerophosphate/cardiolipin synthase-like enzyme
MKDFKPGDDARPDADVRILDKTSSVGENPELLNDELITLVKACRKRIVIENPYVVLTKRALETLKAASANGVEIVLITNSPESTDSAATQASFVENWPAVLAQIPTMRIFVFTGEHKLHAKSATFDDVLSLVSTYNLDYISAKVNSEVMAAVWSPDFAVDLGASFVDDMADPENDLREYTIRKNADGTPVLVNGKPVVVLGAKNHIDEKLWGRYKRLTKVFKKAQKTVPQMKSLNW